MSSILSLKCPGGDGEKFGYPVASGPDALLVCSRCNRGFPYHELHELAHERFPRRC